jgi:hypothetical protein
MQSLKLFICPKASRRPQSGVGVVGPLFLRSESFQQLGQRATSWVAGFADKVLLFCLQGPIAGLHRVAKCMRTRLGLQKSRGIDELHVIVKQSSIRFTWKSEVSYTAVYSWLGLLEDFPDGAFSLDVVDSAAAVATQPVEEAELARIKPRTKLVKKTTVTQSKQFLSI